MHEHVIGGKSLTEQLARAMVEAMEEQFDFETRLATTKQTCTRECFIIVGPSGFLDKDFEVLAGEEEKGHDGEAPEISDGDSQGEPVVKFEPEKQLEPSTAVKAAVRRVHEATGHRSLAGAPLEAVVAAREPKCAVCQEHKPLRARRLWTSLRWRTA